MSRHRNVRADINDYYDDYDHYDDYDYFDDYDDYDCNVCDESDVQVDHDDGNVTAGRCHTQYVKHKAVQGVDCRNNTTSMISVGNVNFVSEEPEASSTSMKKKAPTEELEETVGFILELLQLDDNCMNSKLPKEVAPARVKQMLEVFDNDVNLVLDFFLNGESSSESTKNNECSSVDSKFKTVDASSSFLDEPYLNIEAKHRRGISDIGGINTNKNNDAMKIDITARDNNFVADHKKSQSNTPRSVLLRTSQQKVQDSLKVNTVRGRALSDENWTDGVSTQDRSFFQEKSETTMVVVGHVDAGKSTLIGNLLFHSGNVGKKTVHKYEKLSASIGKSSSHLAWVMDDDTTEREHGVTVDVAEKILVTKHSRRFIVLDAPGHKDFIPKMIKGATQADVALLVVPASHGEYESSMMIDSQTREHAILLKALGVSQIIVVVNKMDRCEWEESRFRVIENEVGKMLQSLQFRDNGILAENLMELRTDNPMRQWYKGMTLFDALDALKVPFRSFEKPLRAIITAVVKESRNICDVNVKVLQGRVLKGRGIGVGNIFYSNVQKGKEDNPPEKGFSSVADVQEILIKDGVTPALHAGQNGTISLRDRGGLSGEDMSLAEGMVLYKGPPILRKCRKFRATIQTTSNMATPMIPGSLLDLYLYGEEIQCFIKKVYTVSHKMKSIDNPKSIPANSSAIVKIKTNGDTYIEAFDVCNSLGRFALRARGVTSAVGICMQCYYSKSS